MPRLNVGVQCLVLGICKRRQEGGRLGALLGHREIIHGRDKNPCRIKRPPPSRELQGRANSKRRPNAKQEVLDLVAVAHLTPVVLCAAPGKPRWQPLASRPAPAQPPPPPPCRPARARAAAESAIASGPTVLHSGAFLLQRYRQPSTHAAGGHRPRSRAAGRCPQCCQRLPPRPRPPTAHSVMPQEPVTHTLDVPAASPQADFFSWLIAWRTLRPACARATAALYRSKSVMAALDARAASFLPQALAANLPVTSAGARAGQEGGRRGSGQDAVAVEGRTGGRVGGRCGSGGPHARRACCDAAEMALCCSHCCRRNIMRSCRCHAWRISCCWCAAAGS